MKGEMAVSAYALPLIAVLCRRLVLAFAVVLLVSACATHELVLSKSLQPALDRPEVDFQLTLFRARVQMDRLEVWGRVARAESEYTPSFELEIGSVAGLAAALADDGLIFEHEWRVLHLELSNEYGGQLRWKNTNGWAKLVIERSALLELKERGADASEYAERGTLTGSKVGPPDFLPRDWTPGRPDEAVDRGG